MSYIPATWNDRFLVLGALVIFALALFWLINYEPFSHGPGAAKVVGIVSTDGPIRRRHSGTLAWSDVDGESEIYFRDIVYTPSNVVALVKLEDGREVPLPPDSLVQFDEITVSNIEISLRETARKEGVFRLIPLPKTQVSRFLPDPMGLEMLFDEIKQRTFKGLDRPLVTHPPIPVSEATAEFQLTEVQDFELKLITPVSFGVYKITTDQWLTMRWTQVPLEGISYQIEIARNPEFRRRLSYNSAKNQVNIQIDNPGLYYWRVRALREDLVMISPTWQFEMSLRGGVSDLVTQLELPKTDIVQSTCELSKDAEFKELLRGEPCRSGTCSHRGLGKGAYFCRVIEPKTQKVIKHYSFRIDSKESSRSPSSSSPGTGKRH